MNQTIRKRIEEINNGIVPEGYKKTSFGIFPCDWETDKKLNDLGSFDKGKGLPGNKMCENGMPCVGYGDIYMKYNYHFEKVYNFVDEETASESQPIKKGTILFTGTGETAEEIGKCICYNGNETIYVGSDIILFNSKNVNPLFLAYQQYQGFSLKRKAMYGQGHSVVHIQRNELRKLNTAFPKDKIEQARIAEILMKWDGMVELQEQYIQKLELRKKYLFATLFDFKSDKVTTLQNLIDNGSVRLIKPKELPQFEGERIYLSTSSIVDNEIVGNEGCISYIKRPSRAQMYPIANSVWFAKMENSVKVYKFNKQQQDQYVLSTGYYGLLCNENKLNSDFLMQVLLSPEFNKIKDLFSEGSSQNGIKDNNLSDLLVYYPKIEKQTRIAKILIRADEETTLQKEKLEKIKLQRKVMQQYLLTGIVRVG